MYPTICDRYVETILLAIAALVLGLAMSGLSLLGVLGWNGTSAVVLAIIALAINVPLRLLGHGIGALLVRGKESPAFPLDRIQHRLLETDGFGRNAEHDSAALFFAVHYPQWGRPKLELRAATHKTPLALDRALSQEVLAWASGGKGCVWALFGMSDRTLSIPRPPMSAHQRLARAAKNKNPCQG